MTFYPSRTVEFFYFHCGGCFRTVNAFSSIFPYTRLMHRYIRADSANGITIRLRSALQRNLIALCGTSRTKTIIENRDGIEEEIGVEKEGNKISECVYRMCFEAPSKI